MPYRDVTCNLRLVCSQTLFNQCLAQSDLITTTVTVHRFIPYHVVVLTPSQSVMSVHCPGKRSCVLAGACIPLTSSLQSLAHVYIESSQRPMCVSRRKLQKSCTRNGTVINSQTLRTATRREVKAFWGMQPERILQDEKGEDIAKSVITYLENLRMHLMDSR